MGYVNDQAHPRRLRLSAEKCLECTNKLVFDAGIWLVDSPASKEILVQQRPTKSTFTVQPYFPKPGIGAEAKEGKPRFGFDGLSRI